MNNSDAARFVSLLSRQRVLASLINKKNMDNTALRASIQTAESGLGREVFACTQHCAQLELLEEARVFLRDTVPLHLVQTMPSLKRWDWVDNSPQVWQTWDTLLAYVHQADVQEKIRESWREAIDITSAGQLPRYMPQLQLDPRRCMHMMWAGALRTLDASVADTEAKIGETWTRAQGMGGAGKQEFLAAKLTAVEAEIAGMEEETKRNAIEIEALKSKLELPATI